MSQINVLKKEGKGDNNMVFDVVVQDGNEKTSHIVLLSEEYFKEITGGKITPEELIGRSFEFLLEREPKESILSEFDLNVISRYFPEYEGIIKK